MTKKELDRYKKLLIKKRDRIFSGLNHITKESLLKSQKEASGDLSSYSFHMADQATDSYDRELSMNLATGEQEILYEIDEALKRIEEQSYGVCLECDKKIPSKRLTAVPYAKYCIECQSKIEKRTRK